MKKVFYAAQIAIVSITLADIISTSNFSGDIELPFVPFCDDEE